MIKYRQTLKIATAGAVCAMLAATVHAQWPQQGQQEQQERREQQGQQFQPQQPQQGQQQQPRQPEQQPRRDQQPQPFQPQPEQREESRREELGRKMQELETRSREIDAQLERIESQASEQNPAILEKRAELTEIFEEKLDEYGYPAESELERLQQMQQQLQAPGGMDDAERMELIQEFQEGVQKIQSARERAQQDPEVQRLQHDFEDKRMQAMMAIDENAQALEEKQEEIIHEFSQMREQLQQIIQQEQMQQPRQR